MYRRSMQTSEKATVPLDTTSYLFGIVIVIICSYIVSTYKENTCDRNYKVAHNNIKLVNQN